MTGVRGREPWGESRGTQGGQRSTGVDGTACRPQAPEQAGAQVSLKGRKTHKESGERGGTVPKVVDQVWLAE